MHSPTYIASRSGKNDLSTTYTHSREIDHLFDLFKDIFTSGNSVKPIGMIFCDGCPDETPRFPKILDVAIQQFKKWSLDALLISTHAQGMSAYNQVKRKMASLNNALMGILLP